MSRGRGSEMKENCALHAWETVYRTTVRGQHELEEFAGVDG